MVGVLFHTVRWEQFCFPKSLGRVGLCRMELCNKDAMSKLAWKFVTQPSLPWVQVLCQRYQCGNHICEVKKLSEDSHVWQRVIEGMEVVR